MSASLWGPQCGGPRNLLPLVPSSSRSSLHDSELIRAISTFCSHGSQWEPLQSRQLGARTIVKHQGGALCFCCRCSGFQEARTTAFGFQLFSGQGQQSNPEGFLSPLSPADWTRPGENVQTNDSNGQVQSFVKIAQQNSQGEETCF